MSNFDTYQKSEPQGTNRVSQSGASILTPYSLGNAAANLEVGQTELEVFPAEIRTYADGEVTDNISEIATSGVDGNGNNYSDNVQVGNSIRAKWLSRNAWLKTPGLVRRGEEVMIWRMGDTDQYYWELLGTSNHLRRRDIVILAISNTDDETTTELTPANSYFLEMNTVDKHISLITPSNDGEACGYTVQLNTKDGTFSLSDTIGNAIVMDSIKELIQLMNASKTTVKLDRARMELFAQEQISINTKVLDIKTETTNLSANTLSMKYSNGTMNGSTSFSGDSLTHNGTNVGASHTHTEQGDGRPTSTPR